MIAKGQINYYRIQYAAISDLETDGKITAVDGGIRVDGASYAVVRFCTDTNLDLRPEVFLEDDPAKKLIYRDMEPEITAMADHAAAVSYDELRSRHIADYRTIYSRAEFELDSPDDVYEAETTELIRRYLAGEKIPYLEMVYFQFGRYLLISCSRPGCMPANLQGVWNGAENAPWGAGYWFDLNVQMNYWPVFNTNMAELFGAFTDYFEATIPNGHRKASELRAREQPLSV